MIKPINACRVNLFFTYKRYTWSETYWRPGSDSPDPTVDDQAALTLATKAGGLCEKRVELLGAGVELVEVRVSRDDVFRDSLVADLYSQWQAPKGARPEQQIYNFAYCEKPADVEECEVAAEPQVCLRVRCQSGSRFRRIMFLSGIPQFADVPGANVPLPAVIDPTGGIDPTVFNNAYDGWAKVVVSDQWGFVGVQYTNSVPIGLITSDLIAGAVTVKTTVAHGLAAGDTCLVFRPKYFPGSYNFHGQQEVQSAPDANTIIVAVDNLKAIHYDSGGTLRGPAVRALHTIDKVIPDIIAERKRGFAELAIRGRSRTPRHFVG